MLGAEPGAGPQAQQQRSPWRRNADRLPEAGPVNWTRGELIGAGAFGRVYLGLNNETGQLMAVKQACPCFASSPSCLACRELADCRIIARSTQ